MTVNHKQAIPLAVAVSGIGVLLFSAIIAGHWSRAQAAPRSLARLASMPLPDQGAYAVQPGPGGTISGKVLYGGKPVRPRKVTVTQDPAVCGRSKEIYPVQVDQGGVVDAVVWIDGITHGKAFAFPKPVLDQKGCMFEPHVVLMQGGDLEVRNNDNATHNVHIFARSNRESNQIMAPGAAPIQVTLMHPETITVNCDVHTWMKAYVIVAENPYYVISGAGGAFQLSDVPAGTYHLKVWQENLGTREQDVTVQPGQTASVTFKLGS